MTEVKQRRAKYRDSFLAEVARFEDCADAAGRERSELGLRQFFDYESRGIVPPSPDPYFVRLLNGKKWWEWTLNNIADTYFTDNWFGWYCYARDFQNDPAAFKQLRQRCGETPVEPQAILSGRA